MITDRMLFLAAVACSDSMTDEEIQDGRTFPAVERIREVSHAVACVIIKEAYEKGLTTKIRPHDMDNMEELVASKMYFPQYVPLVHVKK